MGGKMPSGPSAQETAWTKGQELTLQGELNRAQLRANRPVNEFTPYGTKNWTDLGNDNWTSSETLSPNEQKLYDANTQQQLRDFETNKALNPGQTAVAKGSLEQALRDQALSKEEAPYKRLALYDAYMTDRSKQQANLSQLGKAKGFLGDIGKDWASQSGSMSDYANYLKTGANDRLDMTGLGGIIASDPKERKRIEDAMYAKSTSRLDPQFAEDQRKLGLKLVQSGFDPTSQAYSSAMEQFGRTRNDAYSGARNDAVEFGGTEAQRQLQMQIEARKNALGERQAGVSSIRDSRNQRLGELSSKADMYSNSVKDRMQTYNQLTNIAPGMGQTTGSASGSNANTSGSSGSRTQTQPYNRPQIGGQQTAQMAGTEVGNTLSEGLQKEADRKQQAAAAKKAQTTQAAVGAATAAATIAAAAIAA